MDLLGILFAKEGKKATSFDRVFWVSWSRLQPHQHPSRTLCSLHTETRRGELTTLNVLVAKLGKFVTGSKHVQFMSPELKETLLQLLERVQSSQLFEISTIFFFHVDMFHGRSL